MLKALSRSALVFRTSCIPRTCACASRVVFRTYDNEQLTWLSVKYVATTPGVLSSNKKFVPKTAYSRVRLLDEHGQDQGEVDKTQADELAERRGLRLVLVDDKPQPPWYKLMTIQEYLALRQSTKKRLRDKEFSFKQKTAERDAEFKLTRMLEYLHKGHRVKVIITKSPPSDDAAAQSRLGQQLISRLTAVSEMKTIHENNKRALYMFMPKEDVSGSAE